MPNYGVEFKTEDDKRLTMRCMDVLKGIYNIKSYGELIKFVMKKEADRLTKKEIK
jgi:hypothetical protein